MKYERKTDREPSCRLNAIVEKLRTHERITCEDFPGDRKQWRAALNWAHRNGTLKLVRRAIVGRGGHPSIYSAA